MSDRSHRLDQTTVAEMRELALRGRADRLGELISLFLDNFAGQLSLLLSYADVEDFQALAGISAELRTCSASVGASLLGKRCAELEALASSGTTQFLTASISRVLDEFRAVRPELERLMLAPA